MPPFPAYTHRPFPEPREGVLTWALLQEAVSSFHPVALALSASVGRTIALSSPLLAALGATGGAGAPAGPFIPVSVHCPARGKKGTGSWCEYPAPQGLA